MNNVSFTYRWCRNSSPDVNGRYFLKLRIKIGNNDLWIPVMRLEKRFFDKHKEIVLPTHPDFILLNSKLIGIKKEYSDFQIKMIGTKGFVTLSDFQRFSKGNGRQTDTFNNYFKNIMYHERNLADNSLNAYMVALNKLNQFNPAIAFSELTPTFVRDFQNYMQKNGLSLNSCNQLHTRLQKIITLALRDKIITENPYQYFKPKTKKVVREYLLDEELIKIENLELEGRLKTIRDAFLLSSYTGLRVSDVRSLNCSHIKQIQGETYLVKETVKTKKVVKLPLNTLFNGKPLKILEQYPDFFHDIDPKHLNDDLREVLRLAGINKKITFHCSRHGYFSKLGRETGDIMMIMDLNAVSIGTARRYTKSTEDSIKEKLKQIKW